jgi:hypothetical protein
MTKVGQPSVMADAASSPAGRLSESLTGSRHCCAVNSESGAPAATTTPQALRVMDFSDAQHLRVVREFTGVTAVGRNAARGLIFVANADGVWILQQHFAEDPEVEKAYATYVLYNR